jgi:transposase InsO family protein
MPFKECSMMSQREAFCRQASEPGANIRGLCRAFGISPTTAYKWLRRYGRDGVEGLSDHSRRPVRSPRRTGDELEAAVLAMRAAQPTWGGRKLRRVLENEGLSPPAASTITAILRRHGKLDGPGAGERRDFVRFEHAAPNDLWQMDFKGWFGLRTERCHPLTVLDDHSRFALELGACADEQAVTVRARLEAVFRRHGLPRRILADNGAPWGTGGLGAHSALGVWLMDLDIGLIHGRPYHPQTQGKDERFHRTLKLELLDRTVFADLGQAQAAFDAWREVYNTKRPHEAIGLQTPAQRYRDSPRSMPAALPPPEYDAEAQVRTADAKGRIHFDGHRLYCSLAFAGRRLALRPTDQDGLFELCYRRHLLARIDLRQDTMQPVHHVSGQVFTMSPV